MDSRPRRPLTGAPSGCGIDRRTFVGGALAALPLAGMTAAKSSATGQRRVTFLAQDFRNGGITTVYRAFEEACKTLGWTLNVLNGDGSRTLIAQQFESALQQGVDGIVLGGFDQADIAGPLERAGPVATVLVGWHAAARSGPSGRLFSNIATDPAVVAEMAVALVPQSMANGRAGVVIFNDSRFEIANAKTQRMRDALTRYSRCELLGVEDLPISSASQAMAGALAALQERFGERWTHLLAINDAYMDSMHFPLRALGRPDIVGIAAGDGSRAAIGRIRSGLSQQLATIAEPTGQQGWQLADELRRAFLGQAASGRVWPPITVTTAYLRALGNRDIADDSPYRADYRRQWLGEASAAT
ncbi:substrate-binding domain-containing protein [Pelomonas nitida]|uniref:Substrate-binding domain-containing protein n=1 Tax=Pelomonas nitida TaxID=3299027 RepID=A0ABW7G3W6_9BURK